MFFKSIITVVGVLAAAVVLSAEPISVSGWNWMDGNGMFHEYLLVNDAGCSWEQAMAEALDGWCLATITSMVEQKALIEGLDGFRGEYWLGGYQTGTGNIPEDDWAWVTGETWNYKNWASGEPNDYYGAGTEQHLAVWSRWGTSQWLWNDEACLSNVSGYIVERTQSVPEPGTVALFAIGLSALLIVPKRTGIKS